MYEGIKVQNGGNLVDLGNLPKNAEGELLLDGLSSLKIVIEGGAEYSENIQILENNSDVKISLTDAEGNPVSIVLKGLGEMLLTNNTELPMFEVFKGTESLASMTTIDDLEAAAAGGESPSSEQTGNPDGAGALDGTDSNDSAARIAGLAIDGPGGPEDPSYAYSITFSGSLDGIAVEDYTDSNGVLLNDDPHYGPQSYVPITVVGTYGTFTLDVDGNWFYDLDNTNPAVQSLADGENLTETFTAQILDLPFSQEIGITVQGTNDQPVIEDIIVENINGQIVDLYEDGSFVVAWSQYEQIEVPDNGDGNEPDGFDVQQVQYESQRVIYAQKYNADGEKVGEEIVVERLDNNTSFYNETFSLIALTDGGFTVNWRLYNYNQDQNDYSLHYQRYDLSGNLVHEQVSIDGNEVEGYQRISKAQFIELNDGSIAIAWKEYIDNNQGDSQLLVQRVDVEGNLIGDVIVVAQEGFSSETIEIDDIKKFELEPNGESGFKIVWYQNLDETLTDGQEPDGYEYEQESYQLLYAEFDDEGNQVGETIEIDRNYNYNQYDEPEITSLLGTSEGQEVVSWRGYDSELSESGFFIQLFDSSALVGTPILLLDNDTRNINGTPDIAALQGGGFVVTWNEYINSSGDGQEPISLDIGESEHIVYTQVFDASGNPVTDAIEVYSDYVNLGSAVHHNPSVFDVRGTSDGGFKIGWFGSDSYYGPKIYRGPGGFDEESGFFSFTYDADGNLIDSLIPTKNYEVKDGTNVIVGELSVEDVDTSNTHEFRIFGDVTVTHDITSYGDGYEYRDGYENDNLEDLPAPEVIVTMALNEETGEWEYRIEGDFNYLAIGETATVSFQYVADDLRGFDGTDGIHQSSISEPKTITVTIIGTNDQPVLQSVVDYGEDGAPIIETSMQNTADEPVNTISGTITAIDDDFHDNHFFRMDYMNDGEEFLAQTDDYSKNFDSIDFRRTGENGGNESQRVLVESNDIDATLINVEELRFLNNDRSDSQINFELDGDFKALGVGQTATVTFKYVAGDQRQVSDGDELNEPSRAESEYVTITIEGTNDQPVVKDVNANVTSVLQTWDFNNGIPSDLSVSGATTDHQNNNGVGSWSSGSEQVLNFVQSGTRSITLENKDTSAGGTLSFDFIYGNSSNGGERVDPGEEVVFEYSLDNGNTWIRHTEFDLGTYQDGNWHNISFDLIGDISNSDIDFRLLQKNHSGSCCDHWAINNLEIGASVTAAFYETLDADVYENGLDDTQDDVTTLFEGQLKVQDDDAEDTHEFYLVGDSAFVNNIPVDNDSLEVIIDKDTGEYSVEANFNYLAAGETAIVTFDYYAEDNQDITDPNDPNHELSRSETATVTLEITGTNDQPIVEDVTNIVSEESLENLVYGDGQEFFEDAVYTGSVALEVSDDDDSDTHTFAIDDSSLTISITTTNQKFLDFFSVESLQRIEQMVDDDSDINQIIDFIVTNNDDNADIADSVTIETAQTFTVPQNVIEMLSQYGILNIEMDELGNYSVSSPVFNYLGAHDSITIGFDYRATDQNANRVSPDLTFDGSDNINETSVSEAKTITLTVEGTNDKPVAYSKEYTSLESELTTTDTPTNTGSVHATFSALLPGADTENILGNIFTRMNISDEQYRSGGSMDEDLFDLTTLKFFAEGDNANAVTTVIEEADADQVDHDLTVVDLSATTVVVNEDGSFSVTNPTFDQLAIGESATVTFQYYVDDQSGAISTAITPEEEEVDNLHESTRSEAVTVTVTITGTNDKPFIQDVNLNEVSLDRDTFQVGIINSGVASDDSAVGMGYMMYSVADLNTRFQGLHPQTAEHFIAVKYENGQWIALNNQTEVVFTPEEGDRLVAEIDFTEDTVTMLSGEMDGDKQINGISAGYVDGDLNITPNVWTSSPQHAEGEFGIEGNSFNVATEIIYESSDKEDIVGVDDTKIDVNTKIEGELVAIDDDVNDEHVFNAQTYTASKYYGQGNGGPGQNGDQGNIRFDDVEFFQTDLGNSSQLIKVMIESGPVDVHNLDVSQLVFKNNDGQDSIINFELLGNFNALAEGETATITFEYVADDQRGFGTTGNADNEASISDPKLVTMTITGTNDQPVVDNIVLGAQVFTAVDTPLRIPETGTRGIIESEIEVSNVSSLDDINVAINLNHTWDNDLDIYLVAPDGTRVELTTDNGAWRDNYRNTEFNDEANQDITSGSAPFRGIFRPEGDLSNFDNLEANGTWTLIIDDDAYGDRGTLFGWSLEFNSETYFESYSAVDAVGIADTEFDDTGAVDENLTVLSNILTATDDDNNDTHTMHITDMAAVATTADVMTQTIGYEDGISSDDDTNDDSRVVKVESSDVNVSSLRIDRIELSNNDDGTDSQSNFDLYGDFSSLASGESATITFAYQAEDSSVTQKEGESDFSETKTVTITVTGTNDKPIVSQESYDINDATYGSTYYETSDLDGRDDYDTDGYNHDNDGRNRYTQNDEDNNVLKGKISVEDVDINDKHHFYVVDTAGNYAENIWSNDGNTDWKNWVTIESGDIAPNNIDLSSIKLLNGTDGYFSTLDEIEFELNGNFSKLGAGQEATVTFSYIAVDDSQQHLPGESNTSEVQTVTLTVTGTNDEPIIWSVDNGNGVLETTIANAAMQAEANVLAAGGTQAEADAAKLAAISTQTQADRFGNDVEVPVEVRTSYFNTISGWDIDIEDTHTLHMKETTSTGNTITVSTDDGDMQAAFSATDGISATDIENLSIDFRTLLDEQTSIDQTYSYLITGDFSSLGRGENATIVFDYVARDNSGVGVNGEPDESDVKQITFKIWGTNDQPVITSYDSTSEITETNQAIELPLAQLQQIAYDKEYDKVMDELFDDSPFAYPTYEAGHAAYTEAQAAAIMAADIAREKVVADDELTVYGDGLGTIYNNDVIEGHDDDINDKHALFLTDLASSNPSEELLIDFSTANGAFSDTGTDVKAAFTSNSANVTADDIKDVSVIFETTSDVLGSNDQQYTYQVVGNYNALGNGETATITFAYVVGDNSGPDNNPNHETRESEVHEITLTITGTNDKPVVQADSDSVFESTTNPVTTITTQLEVEDADDTDMVEGHLFHIQNALPLNEADFNKIHLVKVVNIDKINPNTGLAGVIEYKQVEIDGPLQDIDLSKVTLIVEGNDLTLQGEFDPLAGEYTDNSDTVIPAEQLTFRFKYFADDKNGFDGEDGTNENSISDSQWMTITVTGTNDVPTIVDKDLPSAMDEDRHVDNGMLSTFGSVEIDDVDHGQDYFSDEVTAPGNDIGGTFTFYAEDTVVGGQLKLAGSWDYEVSNSLQAVQALKENEFIDQTYTVTSIDGTATHDITVRIWGTEDISIIKDTSELTGEVKEDDTPATLSTTGTLYLIDPDNFPNEAAFKTAAVFNLGLSSEAQLGTLTLVNQVPASRAYPEGQATWTYEVDNLEPRVQELAEGDTIKQVFTITSEDGSSSENVIITITGTNDGPVAVADNPIQNGDILVSEDFENGAEGWSNSKITETNTNATDFLGQFGNELVSKTYSFGPENAGKTITIEFDMLEIDSWDGESGDAFEVYINNLTTPVRTDVFGHIGRQSDIDDGGTPIDNIGTTGVWHSDSDESHHYTITTTLNGNGDLILGFGSTLDQGLSDESWGIDNVLITAGNDWSLTTEENTILDIDVLSNDYDIDNGAVLNITSVDQPAKGSASIFANTIKFNPGTDFDYLATGETATVSFDYTISDGLESDTATVTVVVTGTNDIPTMTVDTGSVIEDTQISTSGQVIVVDADAGQSLVQADTEVGIYGDFSIGTDGVWTYTLATTGARADAVQALREGATVSDSFDVVSADGTVTDSVVVTITGTNDQAAVLALPNESGNESAIDTLSIFDGNLSAVTEIDSGDTHIYSQFGTEVTASSDIDASLLTNIVVNVYGTGEYQVRGNFEALSAGDEATVTFQYVATDNSGVANAQSLPQTVTLTITGTDDAPIVEGITNVGISEDILTELDPVDVNPIGENATYEDSLPTSSNDVNDNHTYVIHPTANMVTSNLNGGDAVDISQTTVTINTDGTYKVENPTFNNLAVGETAQVAFEYIITDPNNQSDTGLMILKITGTNDKPIIDATPLAGISEEPDLITIYGNENFYNVISQNDIIVHDEDNNDSHTLRFESAIIGIGDGYTYADATYTIDSTTLNGVQTPVLDSSRGVLQVTADFLNDHPSVNANIGDFVIYHSSLNALGLGEQVEVTFNIIANDGIEDSDPETVSITITGTNDQPVVSAVTVDAVESDLTIPADNTVLTVGVNDANALGNYVTDEDVNDNHTFTRDAGTALGLTITTVNAELIAALTPGSVDLAYVQSIVAKIVAIPEVTTALTNPLNAVPQIDVAAVLFAFQTAPDVPTALATANAAMASTGVTLGINPANGGLMLSIADASALESEGLLNVTVNLDGSYSVSSPLFDHLSVDDSASINFGYLANDGQGSDGTGADEASESASSTVTVNVQGTNDTPVALDDTPTITQHTLEASSVGQGYYVAYSAGAPVDPFDGMVKIDGQVVQTEGTPGIGVRGITLTVLDSNGNLVSSKAYDTWGDGTASARFTTDLEAVNLNGMTIVITTLDEWTNLLYSDARDALVSIGADSNILDNAADRSSFVMITQKDANGWTVEAQQYEVPGSNVNSLAPFAYETIETQYTDENASITINVLANDSDVDVNDNLSINNFETNPVAGGTVTQVGSQLQFDPGTDFDYLALGETKVVTFTYDVVDSQGVVSNEATVTLVVSGSNDTPEIRVYDTVNLVSNGSFENGVTDWNSSNGFERWTGANVPNRTGGNDAPNGEAIMELDTNAGVTLDGLSQTITGLGNQETYLLEFDVAARYPNTHANAFEVYLGTTLIAIILEDDLGAHGEWKHFTFEVEASSSSEVLSFNEIASSNDSVGPLLDNVQLYPQVITADGVDVNELTPVGTVVASVIADDVDESDVLTYELIDPSGNFTLNPNGDIIVSTVLDADTAPTHNLQVKVTDGNGGVSIEDIVVNVQDLEVNIINIASNGSITISGGTGFYDNNELYSNLISQPSYSGTHVNLEFAFGLRDEHQNNDVWENSDHVKIEIKDSLGNVLIENEFSPDTSFYNQHLSFTTSDFTVPTDGNFTINVTGENLSAHENWHFDYVIMNSVDKQEIVLDSSNEGELDIGALLSQVNDFNGLEVGKTIPDSLDEIDLTSGDHILSNINVEDVIKMTDSDYTLNIKGDSDDVIKLDMSEWQQDGTNPNMYTNKVALTNVDDGSGGTVSVTDGAVKLLIEDDVKVEI